MDSTRICNLGLQPQTLDRDPHYYNASPHDIRYNPNTNQAVIPVRDIQGQLIGVRVRNFEESAVEKGYKYMPLMYIQEI